MVCALAWPAHAHITLEQKQAEAGSYYKATFKVGHGCEGSAIKQIVVTIPNGVMGAKPMPKAGWQIEIEKNKLAQPYLSHGKKIEETVSVVRWTGGPLPDAYYDEFVLSVRLPEQVGPLYWSVSQICEQGRIDWIEVPVPGKKRSDYAAPAPVLEILPKPAVKQDHGSAHKH
jgi:uncharacterized protein YcnI